MEKKGKKRLVLLDAHAILHRAYHALPDFSSSKGEPTGALYGLSLMLLKIIDELKPDYIVSCYDLPKPTYRHEIYEKYKEGRKETEEALKVQLEKSRKLFDAFSIPYYELEGFEADDLLGTITEGLKGNKDIEIIIASGDMDTLQLVDKKRVQVYTLRKGIKDTIIYDEKEVKKRYGFPPEILPDYKGLRGDPSDNIPGIRGVGEKTATTLITAIGDIDDIYEALEDDEGQFLSLDGISPRIVGLLRDNEEEARFSKLLAEIRTDAPIKFKLPEKRWEDAFDVEKALAYFSEIEFRTLGDRVRELFGLKEQKLFEEKKKEDIDDEKLKETAVALWLLDSTLTNPSLADILRYAKTGSFEEAREKILNEIKKEKLERVFLEIEKPLIPIVGKMEERGILLDRDYLKDLSLKYHKELDTLEKKIHKLAGVEFNINSPKQLAEVLFDRLDLSEKGLKKTAGGARSTRESELKKLEGKHPIIDHIFEYRELQKLLSTYIDVLPDMADKEGRLHANFLQTGTTTGRMASTSPNLQNIPIKTDRGYAIRHGFVADEGYVLAALDYSQIELRIAAMLSGDEKLQNIFKDGRDVHREVAAEVFGVSPEKVDSEMRRRAKVINFGILYGMGVNALKDNLGGETTRKEAQDFYDAYFKSFPGLSRYIEKTKAEAAKKGYTRTYYGRKRYFEGINSKIPYIRASAERMAINAPIQGTQSDVIKKAMVEIDEYIKKDKKDTHLLLQVHDELIYEVSKKEANTIVFEIKKIMESILTPKETGGITFIANASIGPNWGELEEVKKK